MCVCVCRRPSTEMTLLSGCHSIAHNFDRNISFKGAQTMCDGATALTYPHRVEVRHLSVCAMCHTVIDLSSTCASPYYIDLRVTMAKTSSIWMRIKVLLGIFLAIRFFLFLFRRIIFGDLIKNRWCETAERRLANVSGNATFFHYSIASIGAMVTGDHKRPKTTIGATLWKMSSELSQLIISALQLITGPILRASFLSSIFFFGSFCCARQMWLESTSHNSPN